MVRFAAKMHKKFILVSTRNEFGLMYQVLKLKKKANYHIRHKETIYSDNKTD